MRPEINVNKAKLNALKEEYADIKRKREIREYERKLKLQREGVIQKSVRQLGREINPVRKVNTKGKTARRVRLAGKIPKNLL